jgi:DNA-binding transcriptional LysR family regulator
VAVNGGNCNYSNLVYTEKLLDDKLVVIASPVNSLCDKEAVDAEDLSGEAFIVHEKTSQLYTYYMMYIREQNLPENISMYLGNIDAIKNAVNANLGISIIPYYSVKSEIETGILRRLKLELEKNDYPYNLIYNKNKNISLTARKFIDVLREVCQSLEN